MLFDEIEGLDDVGEHRHHSSLQLGKFCVRQRRESVSLRRASGTGLASGRRSKPLAEVVLSRLAIGSANLRVPERKRMECEVAAISRRPVDQCNAG